MLSSSAQEEYMAVIEAVGLRWAEALGDLDRLMQEKRRSIEEEDCRCQAGVATQEGRKTQPMSGPWTSKETLVTAARQQPATMGRTEPLETASRGWEARSERRQWRRRGCGRRRDSKAGEGYRESSARNHRRRRMRSRLPWKPWERASVLPLRKKPPPQGTVGGEDEKAGTEGREAGVLALKVERLQRRDCTGGRGWQRSMELSLDSEEVISKREAVIPLKDFEKILIISLK
ncbi:hypothetical protein GW17_00001831 [Ensete ventricosum]|nr:hypothetical protein GW17_00001831 [Ensete ventricosum]RZS20440.1 hypothetical protein BHM03_00052956 [Ensete ventricosum]